MQEKTWAERLKTCECEHASHFDDGDPGDERMEPTGHHDYMKKSAEDGAMVETPFGTTAMCAVCINMGHGEPPYPFAFTGLARMAQEITSDLQGWAGTGEWYLLNIDLFDHVYEQTPDHIGTIEIGYYDADTGHNSHALYGVTLEGRTTLYMN